MYDVAVVSPACLDALPVLWTRQILPAGRINANIVNLTGFDLSEEYIPGRRAAEKVLPQLPVFTNREGLS